MCVPCTKNWLWLKGFWTIVPAEYVESPQLMTAVKLLTTEVVPGTVKLPTVTSPVDVPSRAERDVEPPKVTTGAGALMILTVLKRLASRVEAPWVILVS